MKISYNNKFKIKYKGSLDPNRIGVCYGIEKLCEIDIVVVDGCYYLDMPAPKGPYSLEFTDRTGNECFFNHIHIEDWVTEDKKNLLEYSINYCYKLSEKLLSKHLKGFKIFLTFNEDDYTIRFHKIRENDIVWLDSDLENNQEGVFLITI